MKNSPIRTTIYFDPDIHQALREKAAETDRSISEIVNEAVKLGLVEDTDHLAAFEERAYEPNLLFEDSQKDLKQPGFPTPYPEVNTVLLDLLSQLQAILGDRFVGLYLYGSLASGDFQTRQRFVTNQRLVDLVERLNDLFQSGFFTAAGVRAGMHDQIGNAQCFASLNLIDV